MSQKKDSDKNMSFLLFLIQLSSVQQILIESLSYTKQYLNFSGSLPASSRVGKN